MNKNKSKINSILSFNKRGFSLIELIVVISIMLIITTAILFRQSKFSSDILITNMAYEVALSIREAEVYGVSGKVEVGSGDNFGYGLHFNMIPEASTSKVREYLAFIDIPTNEGTNIAGQDYSYNYFFDLGVDTQIGSNIRMSQGSIKRICAELLSGSWSCIEEGNTGGILDVVFVKPNPEANIVIKPSNDEDVLRATNAIIVVESALGDKCRTIRIAGSGQISVDTIPPDELNGGCDKTE